MPKKAHVSVLIMNSFTLCVKLMLFAVLTYNLTI